MIFWLIVAVMTVAALAVMLLPLVRHYGASQSRRAFDLEVFRDQLGEIEGDLDRGQITDDQAEAARIEVQRRMLALGAPDEPDAAPSTPAHRARPRWFAIGTLGLGVPALAIGLYLSVGSPGMPSQPFAAAPTTGGATMAGRSVEEAIANLERRLADDPQDMNGWLLLGRSFIALERLEDAVNALRRASALSDGNPDIMTMLGEAMVWSADGVVTPDALRLFEVVLEQRPSEPAARFYLGMARAQAGAPQEALDIWSALAAETPIDAPWRDDLVGLMNEAADALGIELADIPGAPSGAPPTPSATGPAPEPSAPGPSAEDMAAAGDMTPDERMEMIRGMVARLAARLEGAPNDLDGWQRLARAYRVLGENANAEAAEQRIAELQAQAQDPARAQDSAPRGPDADDVAAAAEMSESERAQMIRGMVENLSARLEREPGDLQGWLRLANSYRVLGEPAKARDAFAAAANLAPNDVEILGNYARAIVEATPPGADGMPPAAVDVYRRILTLDESHPESLWFVGFADLAQGDAESARALWQRLLKRLPPDTPDFEAVQAAINAL